MHPVALSSNVFRRRLVLNAAGAITVILATGCSDFLAPKPVDDIPDWVVEVGHKMTAPEIIGPTASSDSITRAGPDPNSSVISR